MTNLMEFKRASAPGIVGSWVCVYKVRDEKAALWNQALSEMREMKNSLSVVMWRSIVWEELN